MYREAPDSPNASVESSAEDSEEDEEAEVDDSGSGKMIINH